MDLLEDYPCLDLKWKMCMIQCSSALVSKDISSFGVLMVVVVVVSTVSGFFKLNECIPRVSGGDL